MTTHALFFCLRPDPETARRLSDWSMALFASEGLRPRASRAERLHVTLHHLGWFDDQTAEGRGEMADVLEASIRVGERFTSSPPHVDFDQLLSFTRKPRNCPMVLSGGPVLDEVRALRAALGEKLLAERVRVDPHFTPHLTLTYDDRVIPPRPVDVPGWRASGLYLIDSLQGQSRHELVERWPLRDD